MKKLLTCFFSIVFAVFLFSGSALAQEMSNEELIKELKALKERTRSLEEALEIPEKAETSDIIDDEDAEDLEDYIKLLRNPASVEDRRAFKNKMDALANRADAA